MCMALNANVVINLDMNNLAKYKSSKTKYHVYSDQFHLTYSFMGDKNRQTNTTYFHLFIYGKQKSTQIILKTCGTRSKNKNKPTIENKPSPPHSITPVSQTHTFSHTLTQKKEKTADKGQASSSASSSFVSFRSLSYPPPR